MSGFKHDKAIAKQLSSIARRFLRMPIQVRSTWRRPATAPRLM